MSLPGTQRHVEAPAEGVYPPLEGHCAQVTASDSRDDGRRSYQLIGHSVQAEALSAAA